MSSNSEIEEKVNIAYKVVLTSAIILGGLFSLYKFQFSHQAKYEKFLAEQAYNETKNKTKLNLSIETEYYPFKDGYNVIVECKVKNEGFNSIELEKFEKKLLVYRTNGLYQEARSGKTINKENFLVLHEATISEKQFGTFEKAERADDFMITHGTEVLMPQSTNTFLYSFLAKEPGLIYLEFQIDIDIEDYHQDEYQYGLFQSDTSHIYWDAQKFLFVKE